MLKILTNFKIGHTAKRAIISKMKKNEDDYILAYSPETRASSFCIESRNVRPRSNFSKNTQLKILAVSLFLLQV